jgi:predicted dehydrogenase
VSGALGGARRGDEAMAVRIALLGSGFVATFYMQGLEHVPGQRVVVNAASRADRAEAFARRWGIPEWTTDLERAVARPDVDLVLIALPNHLHLAATELAVRAGKHVVCTKPLGRNPEEARRMLDLVRAAGVLHGYAETEVFSPAVMAVRRLIEQGALGRVLTIRSREAHSGPHAAHFWDPEASGGGALMDMGCHMVEAFRYFLGKDDRPVECVAWADLLAHRDRTRAEDNAVAMIRFASGALGVAEVSWTAVGGLDLRNEVYGDRGAAFTDTTRGTPVRAFTLGSAGYVVEKADLATGWVFPVPDEARVYGYHEEMRHFVACVADGTPPRETYEDGYAVNLVLEACYRSLRSRRWEPVAWPD